MDVYASFGCGYQSNDLLYHGAFKIQNKRIVGHL